MPLCLARFVCYPSSTQSGALQERPSVRCSPSAFPSVIVIPRNCRIIFEERTPRPRPRDHPHCTNGLQQSWRVGALLQQRSTAGVLFFFGGIYCLSHRVNWFSSGGINAIHEWRFLFFCGDRGGSAERLPVGIQNERSIWTTVQTGPRVCGR